MTSFARKVLTDLPDPTSGGAAQNYSTLLEQTDRHRQGQRQGATSRYSPSLTFFGRYGHRVLDTVDQPNIPLPSGGAGNAFTYATNKQFATGFTWARSGTSLLEGRFGWGDTVAGKNPAALGTTSALDAYGITGLPTRSARRGRPAHATDHRLRRPRAPGDQPAVAVPDVVESQDQLHVAGRHALAQDRLRVPVHPDRGAGRQPAVRARLLRGSVHAAAGSSLANNNIYNLADFMFGLRNQYALSNILVADLRQQMHFTYIQDDWRVNDKLTLNLGLRYEYATPHYEKDNVMSNFDPATTSMVFATDGSVEDRALIQPDRNNFGPRLGFAYSLTPKTVVRGGYGISYIHFHRAGAANILSINGPQVINAVATQTSPNIAGGTFRTTEQGYPAGFADPSTFNPVAANITYMPNDYHSSSVQSYYVSVQREIAANMIVDVAYVGNKAKDLLLLANYNQAPAEQRGRHHRAGEPPPDPDLRRHHLRVQRRQVEVRRAAGEVRVPHAPRPDAPQLVHLVEGQGQRRGHAREPERRPARRRRTSTTSTRTTAPPHSTSPTTARRASCGSCRSARASGGCRTRTRSSTRSRAAGRSAASSSSGPVRRRRCATTRRRPSRCPASSRTSAAPTCTGRT